MAEASPHRLPPEQLPTRDPQVALSALVPELPDEPSPVNLFGVPVGVPTGRRFDVARLRRVRVLGEATETAT